MVPIVEWNDDERHVPMAAVVWEGAWLGLSCREEPEEQAMTPTHGYGPV